MDRFLLILIVIILVAVGFRLFVISAREAALREPSTRGDIWALADEIRAVKRDVSEGDVSSDVAKLRKELGSLDTSATVIQERLDNLCTEVSDVSSGLAEIRTDIDAIRSDVKAMRRLLKAIAHHQWAPEWTPD
jgi:peptidoglycan hydrolase CwlO-like protein